MKINKTIENNTTVISLEGRLDTITSPELSWELDSLLDETKKLIFDLSKLDYISSSGLRVLLSAQKAMKDKGTMIVKNASETVMEIFEITGFSDTLTIE